MFTVVLMSVDFYLLLISDRICCLMNLVLLKSSEIGSDNCATLYPFDARTKHIVSHLRKRPGDEVAVGVIGGTKGRATVRSTPGGEKNGSGLVLELAFDGGSSAPAGPDLTLVLAMPYPKTLKALWPVVASMGVSRICLVRAKLSPHGEHCQSSRIGEATYRPLIEEGMSQGGHTRQVKVDVALDEIVNSKVLARLGLGGEQGETRQRSRMAKAFLDCGDESGTSVQPLRDVIMSACFAANDESADGARKVPLAILAVGPERGWTDGEAKLFQEAGFDMALLGNSILRVSTAVVAGLALASAALDECIQSSKKKRKHDTSEC